MKSFIKIAIFCAGIILLLHSFVPHNHQHNNNKEEFYSENESINLFSLFSYVVAFDLGENHLTSFVVELTEIEKKNDFFLDTLFLGTIVQPLIYYTNEAFLVNENNSHALFVCINSNEILFRGPPTYCL